MRYIAIWNQSHILAGKRAFNIEIDREGIPRDTTTGEKSTECSAWECSAAKIAAIEDELTGLTDDDRRYRQRIAKTLRETLADSSTNNDQQAASIIALAVASNTARLVDAIAATEQTHKIETQLAGLKLATDEVAKAIGHAAHALILTINEQKAEASRERRIVAKTCAVTIEGLCIRNASRGDRMYETLTTDESRNLTIAAALLRKI